MSSPLRCLHGWPPVLEYDILGLYPVHLRLGRDLNVATLIDRLLDAVTDLVFIDDWCR